MKIPLNDVQVLEMDVEKLATDYVAQNNVGGTIAEPLVHTMAKDILEFGFSHLNTAIANSNAKQP